MTTTDNSELKSTYKAFKKISPSFNPTEQLIIIDIANKMLDKRLVPDAHPLWQFTEDCWIGKLTNPNEKAAAERKLKGPKLAWEEFKKHI